MKTEREYREEIVHVGRMIWEKGWVAANDGNISIRMDQDRILATPTGVCKGMMHPDDLVVLDMKGNKISGRKMSDAIFIAKTAKGRLNIGDKKELDRAVWHKPRGVRLTPTSRYIRDRLFPR